MSLRVVTDSDPPEVKLTALRNDMFLRVYTAVNREEYSDALRMVEDNIHLFRGDRAKSSAMYEFAAICCDSMSRIDDGFKYALLAESYQSSKNDLFHCPATVFIYGQGLIRGGDLEKCEKFYNRCKVLKHGPHFQENLEAAITELRALRERQSLRLQEELLAEEEKQAAGKEVRQEMSQSQRKKFKRKQKEAKQARMRELELEAAQKTAQKISALEALLLETVEEEVNRKKEILAEEKANYQVAKALEETLEKERATREAINLEQESVKCEVKLDRLTRSDHAVRGVWSLDYMEQPKSFLNATFYQDQRFSELYTLCSSDFNLLSVENKVKSADGKSVLLVTEPVSTIEQYFLNIWKSMSNHESVTMKGWWKHIEVLYQKIFRDIDRGVLFVMASKEGSCGNLAFNMYVTAEGRGKILPSMRPGQSANQDVKDFILEMRRILFLPFPNQDKKDFSRFELPDALTRLLKFITSTSGIPPTFLLDHPYFWTVGECITFVRKLKTLVKRECYVYILSQEFNKRFRSYHAWAEKLKGPYLEVFYARFYRSGADIIRYFGSVYVHVNDREYEVARRGLLFSERLIERDLRNYFSTFYIDAFECICHAVKKGTFDKVFLYEISSFYQKDAELPNFNVDGNDSNAVHPLDYIPTMKTEATVSRLNLPIFCVLIILDESMDFKILIKEFGLNKVDNSMSLEAVSWTQYRGLHKNLLINVVVSGIAAVDVISASLGVFTSIKALGPDIIINVGGASGSKSYGTKIGDVFLVSEVSVDDKTMLKSVFGKKEWNAAETSSVRERLDVKTGKLRSGHYFESPSQVDASIDLDEEKIKDSEAALIAHVASCLEVPVMYLKVVTKLNGTDKPVGDDQVASAYAKLCRTIIKTTNLIRGRNLAEL